MSEKRIDWIDAAKGFAMLLVMIGHVPGPSSVKTWIYTFHMPLFFFLSGYVFKIRDGENFWKFVQRKTMALVIPMLLFSIVALVVDAVYYCAVLNNITIQSVMQRIPGLLIQQRLNQFNGYFWFIPCLFLSEIIFYFLFHLKSKKILFLLVLLTCSLIGWLWWTYICLSLPWSLDLVPVALFFIGCGALARQKKQNITAKLRIILIIIFLIASIAFGALNCDLTKKNIDIINEGNYFLYYITALSGIGFTTLLFQTLNFKRGITYIGRNSLIYYCMHDITYAIPNIIVYNVFHFDTGSLGEIASLGISAMYVTMACVILYFVSKFINRYCPFMLGKFHARKDAG